MGFWPAVKRLSLGVGLIAAAALVLLAADWKHRAPSPAAPPAAAPATGRMLRVALFQFASRPVLDDGMRGVTDALREAGWQDGRTLEFKRFNPESDLATADSMAKAIIGGNFDLVVTLSTPCLQVMAGANRKGQIRQVFGIVTDPFGAGVGLARGQPRAARPAGLCGAGTFQPVREVFQLVRQVRPDLKTVGVVWCPGETCSRACLDLARDECAKLGITLQEATVDNSNGVYEAAQALVARGVQALWIGGDNIVELAAASVIKAGNHGRIPVFTNAPVHAAAGALLNLGADYYEVGRATGRLADAVLRGRDPRDVPVENLVPRRLVVNPAVLPALRESWTLPPEVLATAEVWRPGGAPAADGPAVAAAAPTPGGAIAGKPLAEPGRNYQLGLAYFAPEVEFDSAQRGLFDGLRELGFVEGANLEVRRVHAQGETSNIPAMLQALAATPAEAIVTFTTPVLAGALAGLRGKPLVCTYVTDPLAAGAGESPERHRPNVTGVGCLPPLAETAAFFRLTFPRLRVLGTLYNPGDASSVRIMADWRRLCAANGWKLEEMTMAGTSEAQQAMLALVARGVEAVYIPSDNTAYQAFGTLVKTAVDARLPLVADAPEFMQPGVLATIGVGYYHSGRAAAEPLARVFRGESPAAIPIRNVTVARILLNPDTARRLGIAFPAAVLRMQEDAAGLPPAPAAPPAVAAAAPAVVPGPVSKKSCWSIHLIDQVEAPAIAASRQGVLAGLAEAGLVEGRDYVIKHRSAQGDLATLNALIDAALTEQADMVYTVTTPALQTALRKVTDRPLLFCLSIDPLLVGDAGTHERHRANVAGVYDRSPFEAMMALIKECLPGVKGIGTLYNPSEVNAVAFKEELERAGRAAGLRVVAVANDSASQAADAAAALTQRGVEAICQINDNLHDAAFPGIAQAARRARLPVFCFSSGLAEQGACVVLANDHFDGGRESGLLAAQVMRGAKPADLPYTGIKKTRLTVNLTAAGAVGLALPAAVTRRADRVIGAGPAARRPPVLSAGRFWGLVFLSHVDAAMVEQTIRGFRSGLTEQGLVEGRDYTLRFQCAQGDMPTLMTLLDGANGTETDLVVV
ncbi:MAG: ABC transporter substrate binding protein, partial [Lentisphaeria bacterium]